jgi:hypothetical protein
MPDVCKPVPRGMREAPPASIVYAGSRHCYRLGNCSRCSTSVHLTQLAQLLQSVLSVFIDSICPIIITCKCSQVCSMQNTTHDRSSSDAVYRDTAISKLAAAVVAAARLTNVVAAASFRF